MLDAATLAAGLERVDRLVRDAHARCHPTCRQVWRERSDALVLDGWRWFGCGDHAPSTDSGIAGRSQTERARQALREGAGR